MQTCLAVENLCITYIIRLSISAFPKLWILPISDHVVFIIEKKNLTIVNILNSPHVAQGSTVLYLVTSVFCSNKYLLSTFYMPGSVLNMGDTSRKKSKCALSSVGQEQ